VQHYKGQLSTGHDLSLWSVSFLKESSSSKSIRSLSSYDGDDGDDDDDDDDTDNDYANISNTK